MARILLIETARASQTTFEPELRKRYARQLALAPNGKLGITLARLCPYEIVVLNAASMRTTGERLCKQLREALPTAHIIHLVSEKPSRQARADSHADELLVMPFTYRKVRNRIERYLRAKQGEIITRGPFRLNIEQHILSTPDGDQKLTPKLSHLMRLLMTTPGQLVERRHIIKEVWMTDYMGDTRTLDVHIRWMRQAIEKNPSAPRYLKTVRGQGYLLDIPDHQASTQPH